MKGYGDLFIMNLAGCWGFAMTMFHGLFSNFHSLCQDRAMRIYRISIHYED